MPLILLGLLALAWWLWPWRDTVSAFSTRTGVIRHVDRYLVPRTGLSIVIGTRYEHTLLSAALGQHGVTHVGDDDWVNLVDQNTAGWPSVADAVANSRQIATLCGAMAAHTDRGTLDVWLREALHEDTCGWVLCGLTVAKVPDTGFADKAALQDWWRLNRANFMSCIMVLPGAKKGSPRSNAFEAVHAMDGPNPTFGPRPRVGN